MPPPSSQKLVGAYVKREDAERFEAWARQTDGGASAALRRLIAVAVDGKEPSPPRGTGKGTQIGVRLKGTEFATLAEAANSRGCTPANWLRSLAIVHLSRRPQWSPVEVEALREVFRELRAIGNNINQIARSLNVSVLAGDLTEMQGADAKEAAELVHYEMRRVTAVMTGNFDYWGLPDADRPTAASGAVDREAAAVSAAEAARKLRPRRRPARFIE